MSTRRSLILGLALYLAMSGVGAVAWATVDNQKSFKAAYPGKDPKAYSCKVCHQGMMGKKGDLNAYGLALQKHKGAGKALKLTEEDYRAIEPDDADEDGVSNADEINGGTSPGDPASTPAGAQAPSAQVKPTTKTTVKNDVGTTQATTKTRGKAGEAEGAQ